MRTQWTAKGNRDAGSSCLCDRGLHRYLQNFGEGLNNPNPPSVRHCVPPSLIIKISAYCPHNICMCSVWFRRNSNFFPPLEQLLNALTTSPKAAIGFVMSVRPRGTARAPLDGFNEMWSLRIFHISVEKTDVSLKSVNTNLYFDVFLTVHHSIDLFQVTNLMHTSFIL